MESLLTNIALDVVSSQILKESYRDKRKSYFMLLAILELKI